MDIRFKLELSPLVTNIYSLSIGRKTFGEELPDIIEFKTDDNVFEGIIQNVWINETRLARQITIKFHCGGIDGAHWKLYLWRITTNNEEKIQRHPIEAPSHYIVRWKYAYKSFDL